MKRTRRNHSAAYKAKVALAALKGDKTLVELSQQFDVHVNQITQWKSQLLERATERDTPMGRLRVISVEGLIGFKLQGYVNDATRTRDLDDIRALVRQHRATLNTQELQSYFALFHQLDLFHALLD